LNWRRIIPWLLVTFRAAAGPVLVVMSVRMAAPQTWLGALIGAGFVSDVYDGVLARRWGTATVRLRTADSATDLLFYICVLIAAIVRHGPVLRHLLWLLTPILLLEAGRLVLDWIKFGRMTSYHSYAAKAWGVMLALAAIALLGFDRGLVPLAVALAWGIFCEFEGWAMSLLLPEWAHDVKHLSRALELRRRMLARSSAAPVPR
jgi:CDP-diacylglycerol--glycerol-3-phosphate 3-phosphatidyltransferase